MTAFFRSLFVAALVGVLILPAARADVTLGGTRVIYPASARQVVIRLTNAGKLPSLVQVWADRSGDLRESPLTPENLENAPFLVTPPIFRLDAGRSQVLRLRYAGEILPSDRESAFWLNVLDVPPEPEVGEGEENFVQLAVRTRVKIFYRPVQLAGSLEDSVRSLQWRVLQSDTPETTLLRVSNPGAYHVSFNRIALQVGERSWPYDRGGMVPPGASLDLRLPGPPTLDANVSSVRYQWINDFGAGIDASASLTVAETQDMPAPG